MEKINNLRACLVDGRPGLFHCWEHRSDVIAPSPMIGGHPGGQISMVYGSLSCRMASNVLTQRKLSIQTRKI